MRYRTYSIDGSPVSEIALGSHQEGVETGSGITGSTRFFRTQRFHAGPGWRPTRTM